MNDVPVRPLQEVDVTDVVAFFERIPEGDRTFFKEPFVGEATVRGWLADGTTTRWVAVDGDRAVGYVAVVPGVGWSAHVGELRLVVDPSHRGRGLGRRLARHAVQAAPDLGIGKLVVEVVADQVGMISLFQGLGFQAEALLEDQVRDGAGRLMDLIVLAHRPDETWRMLRTVGLDAPLG